jgi:hypothetical protein
LALPGGTELTIVDRRSGEAAADEFGSLVADRYVTAAAATDPVVRTYRIADGVVRIEFAGPALAGHLTAALEPGRTEDDEQVPDLMLRVFDSASTGVEVPAPPWSWDDFTPSGEIAGFASRSTRLAFQLSAGAMNVHRPDEQSGWYWTPSAERLTAHDVGAPFLFLLHWWLADRGLQVVHAAGVGFDGRGALLVGPGGSGKSSTALACVRADGRYVGDDYCALEPGDRPLAHRLFATAKADDASLGRLDDLDHHELIPPTDTSLKTVLDLAGHHGDHIDECLPVDLLLLPEVVGGEASTVIRVGQFEALRALGPSTMIQLPGTGPTTWRHMATLAAQTPACRLHLGTDAAGVAAAVAGALAPAGERST